MKDGGLDKPFVNDNIMVTDLLEMDDDISRRLVEYFDKNFDVNFEKLKEESRRQP